MCLIIYKPVGVEAPREEILKKAFVHNNDGAGFMIVRDGQVQGYKGYMRLSDLVDTLREVDPQPNEKVVYHFRLATHGTVTESQTHPFPVSSNMEEIRALRWSGHVGVVHNGVIFGFGKDTYELHGEKVEYPLSDTQEYVMTVMNEYPVNRLLFTNGIKKLIGLSTDSNWVFMREDGEIATVGLFLKAENLLFSNDSILQRVGKDFEVEPLSSYDYIGSNFIFGGINKWNSRHDQGLITDMDENGIYRYSSSGRNRYSYWNYETEECMAEIDNNCENCTDARICNDAMTYAEEMTVRGHIRNQLDDDDYRDTFDWGRYNENREKERDQAELYDSLEEYIEYIDIENPYSETESQKERRITDIVSTSLDEEYKSFAKKRIVETIKKVAHKKGLEMNNER